MGRKIAVTLPLVVAALNVIVPVLPIPAEFGLVLKVPAAMLTLAVLLFAPAPRRNATAMWLMVGGAVALGLYLAIAWTYLYTNPRLYVSGDNSVIGFWPTQFLNDMVESGQTLPQIYESVGPRNWSAIYSRGSQLTTVAVIAMLYCGGLVALTLGLKRAR